MNEKNISSPEDRLKNAIDTGSAILSGLLGTAIGMSLVGPVGSLVGAAAGPFVGAQLRRAAIDQFGRVLSPREEARLGLVFVAARTEIQRRLDIGQKVREDDFFYLDHSDRSAAKEVAEGILSAAQREYEERKIPHFGNLLANIAFDSAISREMANHFVTMAHTLSYRQFCLLLLASKSAAFHEPLRDEMFDDDKEIGSPVASLLSEMRDLYNLGLIRFDDDAILNVRHITPSKMRTTEIGLDLSTRLNLELIPVINSRWRALLRDLEK